MTFISIMGRLFRNRLGIGVVNNTRMYAHLIPAEFLEKCEGKVAIYKNRRQMSIS